MANDLTGDFDVVAEFTLSAANRVLAAMHSVNRFPHSWSLRVDDTLHSKRTARSIVDVNGDVLTDPAWVNAVALAPSTLPSRPASDPVLQRVDPLVNLGDSPALGPADKNHLRGVAQLQFGPPTLTVPNDSGTSVVAHTPVMARYFPDPGTMNIPEYLHGVIEITFGAHESIGQAGTFIDVNLVGLGGNPRPWSSAPLPPPQLAAIDKALRNSLVNSFQPSSTRLPTSIFSMQFKTMPPDSPALAVLINLPNGPYAAGVLLGEGLLGLQPGAGPDPADVTQVFLQGGDDFALAVSSDYIEAQFTAAINAWLDQNNLRQFTIPPISNQLDTGSGNISNVGATVALQEGQILLTISGHVHLHFDTSSWAAVAEATGQIDFSDQDFNFQILQNLNLQVSDDGDTAQLGFPDNGSVQIMGSVSPLGRILFLAYAPGFWRSRRDDALNKAQGIVGPMLGANENLGQFLNSLPTPVSVQLAYTSVDIHPSGVILHGSLQVPAWPPAHLEFDSRTFRISSGNVFASGTEYSALKSWIPGGTITEFIWNLTDGPQLRDDHDTFVLPNAQVGFRQLCLTINGTRVGEDVTATFCSWGISFNAAAGGLAKAGGATGRPKVVLTQLADSGALEVVGHTSPWAPADAPPSGAANLIVHFPDNRTVAHLDFLTRALKESGRTDAATGIVAVLTPEELAKLKPVDGIMFADDDAAWAHLLGVKGRPATFVIDTSGKVVWHHEGELTSADLAAALKTHLAAGGSSRPRLLQAGVRMGQPTPNFLFESAPGQPLTLRKLAGRPVVLVFWMSSSPPSLETLRDLQIMLARAGNQAPVVLAINDGEPSESARRVAAENGLSAIVVPDPRQDISSAYGVNIWPTTIFLDDTGLVINIRYGRFAPELARYASQAKRAGA